MLLEFSLYQIDTFQKSLNFYENDCNSFNSSLDSSEVKGNWKLLKYFLSSFYCIFLIESITENY